MKLVLGLTTLLLISIGVNAALTPEELKLLPPVAAVSVEFSRDIKPIFEASCVKCHGRGKSKGGFRLDDRHATLTSGDSGPAVVPGNSAESYLIELVSGIDPDNVMPQKGSKLTREQVALLRAWIDQGAKWDQSTTFAKLPALNLAVRKPAYPLTDERNPIDQLLDPYFILTRFTPPPVVNDRIFARRVYLDLIGVLPSPIELERFLENDHPLKRQRLARELLADNRRYAEHWLTFWNDALRNDYRGTGYIDGGRKQITEWLYAALANNMPYDQFVSQLINPTSDSEGFTKGIVWRGVVNASQTPQMQAAQNISQVFMGVNLKCASCHDSFINDWTLADAYGLASIYSEEKLEMVHCDKPTGEIAAMKFIYPELGTINPNAPKAERLKQLAEIISSDNNGRLTRTIVNRLWARFMGRGLVEPVDDMERPAWHADLLDWLAEDLARNGYNLKRTIEQIVTSQAYQLPSVPATEQQSQNYTFTGPFVRRLTAEQYVDAIASTTRVGYTLPVARVDFTAGFSPPNSPSETPVTPKWIWNDRNAASRTEAATIYFRKVVHLTDSPTTAAAVVTCDNSFKLYLNGKEIASGRDHTKPSLIDLRPNLKKGGNVIAIAATNGKAAPNKSDVDQSNPAGLFFYARIRTEELVPIAYGASESTFRPAQKRVPLEKVFDVASDDSWICSEAEIENWETAAFDATGWQAAAELGDPDIAPWKLGDSLSALVAGTGLYGEVRASLVTADPVLVALGRPNREQVITARSSAATTLQALELTNGETLAEQLKRGTARILDDFSDATTPELVSVLFERALSRPPTNDELRLAEELLGSPAASSGVEDLLWSIAMLPEFQLIY